MSVMKMGNDEIFGRDQPAHQIEQHHGIKTARDRDDVVVFAVAFAREMSQLEFHVFEHGRKVSLFDGTHKIMSWREAKPSRRECICCEIASPSARNDD
jgi:hypothetical protein